MKNYDDFTEYNDTTTCTLPSKEKKKSLIWSEYNQLNKKKK